MHPIRGDFKVRGPDHGVKEHRADRWDIETGEEVKSREGHSATVIDSLSRPCYRVRFRLVDDESLAVAKLGVELANQERRCMQRFRKSNRGIKLIRELKCLESRG